MVSWLDFPSWLFISLSFLSYSFILWTQNSFGTEHWKQIKSTIHSVALCIPKVLFSPYSFSKLLFFLSGFCIFSPPFIIIFCYCLSLGLNLCHAQFISFSLYFPPLPKVWFLLHLTSCSITFFLSSFASAPSSATLTFSHKHHPISFSSFFLLIIPWLRLSNSLHNLGTGMFFQRIQKLFE